MLPPGPALALPPGALGLPGVGVDVEEDEGRPAPGHHVGAGVVEVGLLDALEQGLARLGTEELVGLPIGILAKLVMSGYVVAKGVNIPVMKSVYEPVLEELKAYGVHFVEQESLKISG